MRYLSRLFQPVITIPKNATLKNTEITCKSQKLLLECGLIRPTGSGLFSILPIAHRSIDKLEQRIRQCLEDVGAQRMSLPCLTAASLWEKTGRLQSIGAELMKMKDRHGKEYVLAPTHEEALADLLADIGPISYKQLPFLLYQITNKYRDEHRPKHGLLRSREFLMMDAYGLHDSIDGAKQVYKHVTEAYQRLFVELQLPVQRVSAPSGAMGGALSHEWQLPADSGEDRVSYCGGCRRAALAGEVGGRCGACGGEVLDTTSIEVGHTFLLGTHYSGTLEAHYTPAAGPSEPLIMSCYGIGVTRLLAASLEALSSDTCLRWPKAIAPYTVCIIGPKEGSKEWQNSGWETTCRLYDILATETQYQSDIVIDDRHHLTIGKRLVMADRMGYPYVIVCGKSSLESPAKYEIHCCLPSPTAASPQLMTIGDLIDYIKNDRQVVTQIKTV